MTPDLPRLIFALLCLLAAIAIAAGASIEILRARRGDSLLAPWHLRLRVISAFLWIFVLLTLSYATTRLWPAANATHNQKLQFISVFYGISALVVLGLFLLAGDIWVLARARNRVEREQAIRFSEQLHELAEAETKRLRTEGRTEGRGIASTNGQIPLSSDD